MAGLPLFDMPSTIRQTFVLLFLASAVLVAAGADSRAFSKELSTSDFKFDGPFGSHGAGIENLGKNHFKVTLGHAPNQPTWCNMLQFQILRNAKGNTLKLEVFFYGGNAYRFNSAHCSWSYNGVDWQPINWQNLTKDSSKGDILLFPKFTKDTVYFGHQVPMSYENVVEMMNRFSEHPDAKVHILGKSLQGRNIYRLEITAADSPHRRNTRWVHYFANQHPGEHNAQWRMVGMVEWLLSDAGTDCRRRSICHFTLMMYPDGPANGWYRVGLQGVDGNRTYLAGGADKEKQPHEAYIAQRDLELLMASDEPVTDLWSMHTWGGTVEPIMLPGPEIGTILPEWTVLRDIIKQNDPQNLVEPLAVKDKPGNSTHWNYGPNIQFGITNILCEGAGGILTKKDNKASGVVLMKSLAQYYQGTKKSEKEENALAKVLIIGDSISLGYTPYVVKLLQDKAVVIHNPANARDTRYGLENLDEWLEMDDWDVIHFNWGLWDLRRDNGFDKPCRVPLDQYRRNLTELVTRLKAAGARLIWAATTPVPDGAARRIPGTEHNYNKAALEIIDAAKIHTNDLHSLMRDNLKRYQIPANVHFYANGSQAMALQVANEILQVLKQNRLEHPWDKPWKLRVVDDSSKGADGVRLADADGDGRMDIVTGWEEGGITKVYLHPGKARVTDKWPAVTVGRTPSVEDAVFVDLDGDEALDVVSCCEGSTKTMYVHWAPKNNDQYLNADKWRQSALPASTGLMQWMFCMPLQVDGKNGIDLVAGAKGGNAQIGWFESPPDARDLAAYKWRPISPAGWIMSLKAADMDGDGDLDIVTSDRKGPLRGCRWLENPGQGVARPGPWNNHFIGAADEEVMFMTIADFDADGAEDVLAAVKGKALQKILLFRRLDSTGRSWKQQTIPLPDNIGTGKGVAVGDIDKDSKLDIVFSCENSDGKSGLMWLSQFGKSKSAWLPHEISGIVGIKYDRIELLDMDTDGDLDVLTCEESAKDSTGKRKGLGVIWYENPGT